MSRNFTLIFSIAILVIGSFSSCVKSYECECVRTYADNSKDSAIHIYEGKRAWAEETCNMYDAKMSYFTEDCKLK